MLRTDHGRSRIPRRLLCCSFLVLIGFLGGCGDVTRPVVGQISFFADAAGDPLPPPNTPITSVLHNTSIYLDAVLSNDPESLGVDWTVTCSSSAPTGSLPAGTVDTSCGSFSLYHTISGPIPSYPATGIVTQYTTPANVPKAGTVTIVAHATSYPDRTSSITLTIM